MRQAAYKHQVAKYYNQRVKHKSFMPSKLVLRKVTLFIKGLNDGKFRPTWNGLYRVIKVTRLRTYWLEDMRGGHYLTLRMSNIEEILPIVPLVANMMKIS